MVPFWEFRVTGTTVDGINFVNESNYLSYLEVNKVHTWGIENSGGFIHPLHIHVNHFQIINTTFPTYAATYGVTQYVPPDGFVESGDWADTLYGPGWLRFYTDIWAGTVTMHCHILQHEDEGAMGTVQIINGCDNDYNDFAGDNKCNYTDTCGQFTPGPTVQPTAPTTASPTGPSNQPTAIPTS